MICKSGNFDATTEEDEDVIQIEKTNSTKQIQQNVIKKSYLPEKIRLAIKNIDFNKKKREDLNFFFNPRTNPLMFFILLMILQVITVKY